MNINSIVNLGLDFAGIIIIILVNINSFITLECEKCIKLNIKKVLLIIGAIILIYCNGVYNYTVSKGLISLIIYTLFNKYFFNRKLTDSFIASTMFYMILTILDLINSIFFLFLPIKNIYLLDQMCIIKLLFTLLSSFSIMLLLRISQTRKFIINFYNKIIKNKNFYVVCLILLLVFSIILTFNNINNLTLIDYLINIIFLVLICLFLIIIYCQNDRMQKFMEKQSALLEFIEEYEKIIDELRMNKHETLNNLLLLKSVSTAENEEYNSIISNIIASYETKSINIKNVYNLPAGLKGLFYYKLHYCSNKNINTKIFISNRMKKQFECQAFKSLYEKIYKILAILLDNAIEACLSTKEKHLLIDIYEKGNKVIFYIENSFISNDLEFNKIKNKCYSTKGQKRGYGLYIAEKIMQKVKNIKLTQKVTGKIFSSELQIKL